MGRNNYYADIAYKNFVKMWKRLAKTGSRSKPQTSFLNNCPLCSYLENHITGGVSITNCQRHCLVVWPGSGICEVVSASPYQKWMNADNVNERRKFAAQIWRLPRREV